MSIFYCARVVKKYIPARDGGPDYAVAAAVLIEEAETMPKHSVISIGEYTTSKTYFESKDMAVAFADLQEPGRSHGRVVV